MKTIKKIFIYCFSLILVLNVSLQDTIALGAINGEEVTSAYTVEENGASDVSTERNVDSESSSSETESQEAQSNVTDPETTNPETTDTETEDTETEDTETTDPETEDTETEDTETTDTETEDTETTDPETTDPETTDPETTDPETTDTETEDTETTDTETTIPDTTEPDTTEPNPLEPDQTEPNPTEPDGEPSGGGSGGSGSSDEELPDSELFEEELLENGLLEDELLEEELFEEELLEEELLEEELLEEELVEIAEVSEELLATLSATESYGTLELILPTNTFISNGEDIGDGVASDMDVTIYIQLEDTTISDSLYYLVTVYDESAMEVRSEVMEFTYCWTIAGIPWDEGVEYPVHALQLTDIAPGGAIFVYDIATSGSITDQWGEESSWTYATAGVYLSNLLDAEGNDISDQIGVYENTDNPVLLSPGALRTIKYTSINADYSGLYYQTLTNDEFEDAGNHYSGNYNGYEYLDKLLNSINVFSFYDIEGTHIVGPIVAQNEAYYKRETPISTLRSTSKLIFADYSRSTPSYIGNLTARTGGGRDSAANYEYDDDTTGFIPPILYTSTSTWLINNGGDSWLQEYVVIKGEEDEIVTAFLSPNNSGETAINHNDDYFDFADYFDGILEECINLLEDGSIENYSMEFKTYDSTIDGSVLEVQPGECWNVVNADNLEQINIILPEGVDYFESSSPAPLTINFTCDTINPTVIDGKTASQFPVVTFNGEEFESEESGETIEFNEFGNKLIFNMPYIVTDEDGNNRVVTVATSQNIPGHLLMPQAEFWNYQENDNGVLVWEGGNINGLLLAADVHVGETEMHMWAYGGLAEQFATYAVTVLKKVNGLAPQDDAVFEFALDFIDGDTDGLYTSNYPLIAESDQNGDVQFQNLVFTAAGTYEFSITEVIPSGSSNYTYDQSEYRLIVVVEEDGDGFKTTGTFTQVKDSDGNDMAEEAISKIVFNNLNSSSVFPTTGGKGTQGQATKGLFLLLIALLFLKMKDNQNYYKSQNGRKGR